MTDTLSIRLAMDSDYEAILQIWLDGIDSSFDLTTMNPESVKKKFAENFYNRHGVFNFWVAVDKEGKIFGWQSLIKCFNHPFKEQIYAESSTYLAKENRFKGLGEHLLNYAISEAEKGGVEYLVGFVAINNKAAKKITKATGWIEVGIIPPSKSSNSNLAKHFILRPL